MVAAACDRSREIEIRVLNVWTVGWYKKVAVWRGRR